MLGKFFFVIAATALLISAVSSAKAETMSNSLISFEEDVAKCRRSLRQYCAIVQKSDIDNKQRQQALEFIKEARKLWENIQSKYGTNPPAEYQKDTSFKFRLIDIANAIDDMEKSLTDGDSRRSFMSCAYGCGLFVKMHQENGLVYAIDKLYAMRQTAKIAESILRTKGKDGVRGTISALMNQRDELLLTPYPFSKDSSQREKYINAIRKLSELIDEIALSVNEKDEDELAKIISTLVPCINIAYEIAL
ncbi:MAG: hypothetical protein NC831_06150 [Candidatus Omnitrophica bacterium]|nr:hypothetical protein [Candidatus Omnitrophota bacterium]